MSIDINGGVHIGTIEIYAITLAFIGLISSKSLAIPPYTTGQCTSSVVSVLASMISGVATALT